MTICSKCIKLEEIKIYEKMIQILISKYISTIQGGDGKNPCQVLGIYNNIKRWAIEEIKGKNV